MVMRPSMYSMMAELPVTSLMAMWRVVSEPPGIVGASMRNLSWASACTASEVVAKLSRTNCAHIDELIL